MFKRRIGKEVAKEGGTLTTTGLETMAPDADGGEVVEEGLCR